MADQEVSRLNSKADYDNSGLKTFKENIASFVT